MSTNFYEFVNKLRIEEARERLLENPKEIIEWSKGEFVKAFKLGFEVPKWQL